MLDDLLGRTRLKRRIEELESEVESLEERLEAENRRRADAVTEKQEAERQINKLESKIDELEGRLEHEGEESKLGFRRVETLVGDRLTRVLDLLDSVEASGETLSTAFVEAGREPDLELEGEETALLRRVDSGRGYVAYVDDYGVVRVCVVPPLPVENQRVIHGSGFHVERTLFRPDGVHAVAAIRSDTYAGGVYGDDRLAYSVVSSNVKGGHSKGGWSQGRFDRRREEQVERHVDEALESYRGMVGDYDPEVVAVVGESNVAELFAEEIDADVTRAVDARGTGEEFLKDAYEKLWVARLYVF